MKKTILFLLLILASQAFPQYNNKSLKSKTFQNEKWNMLGRDGMENLNTHESEYFNKIFAETKKGFDFTGKKIGFITGNNARVKTNKKEYFELERIRLSKGQSGNGGSIIEFNEEEKVENGGYDAAILYWCKVIPNKKDLIKLLFE